VSGWQDKPHWVKNLLANPQITIQPVHNQPVAGVADRVQDDQTLTQVYEAMQVSPLWESWLESLDIQPNLEDFLANKARVYVFQIIPQEERVLPPLAQDLRWVMPGLVIGTIALTLALNSLLCHSKRE